MAYPGNLHALVSRDRHVNSLTGAYTRRTDLALGNPSVLPNDKAFEKGDPCDIPRSGRHRRKKKTRNGPNVDSSANQGKCASGPSSAQSPPRAFRPTDLCPSQAILGANAWQISPSEYGKRMDTHGMFEPKSFHLNAALSIKTTRAAESMVEHGDFHVRGKAQAGELQAAKKLYGEAVSLRKRCLKKHAVWLMDGILQPSKSSRAGTMSDLAASSTRTLDSAANGNTSVSRSVASPTGIQWPEPHAVGQAGHVGIPLMPRNPFRDAMAQRIRAKEARQLKATSSSGMVSDGTTVPARRRVGKLVRSRVAAEKRSLLRYKTRWHEVAMLHRLLETESNWRPARETLERVSQAMEDTACENPVPGCLSRAQFISTLSGTLHACDNAALHRMYSSFDPDGTDRVRYVIILACLLVTHKPETEALLEGLQQTFLGNSGAIGRDLLAELTKGGRQVAWRFLRRLFQLFNKASKQLGVILKDVEHLFQVCATSDEDLLQMSSTFTAYLQEFPLPTTSSTSSTHDVLSQGMFERHFCTAWPLLDFFNAQMTTCQAIVKRAMLAK